MMSERFDPDPSDLSQSTIQQLFYRQMRSLSVRESAPRQKMRSFDLQFSDAWF